MEKKNIFRRIWNAIDGKKTAIGIALHAGWFVANMAFPSLSTQEEALLGHGVIGMLTGVGIGHKIDKAISKANQK